MNVKNRLRELYYSNDIAYRVLYGIRWISNIYKFYILSDQKYLKKKFQQTLGYPLDLENPCTLNEKIQWLKLYDRKDWYTDCADKYKVRDYLKSIVGEKYLVPLIFTTKNVKELKPENFPDYPVVIKSNHDSGSYKIVMDKSQVDWAEIRKFFRRRLRENYYYSNREWQYKNIERRLIIEKFVSEPGQHFVSDFKFQCIHGKVELVSFSQKREDGRRYYSFCNAAFEPLGPDVNWGYDKKDYIPAPSRPKNYEEMLEVVSKIAQHFRYIRVDLFGCGEKIYIGELTFHDGGGFLKIEPEKYAYLLGEKLKLEK